MKSFQTKNFLIFSLIICFLSLLFQIQWYNEVSFIIKYLIALVEKQLL